MLFWGIQTRQLLHQLSVPLRLDILGGSLAARGICTHSGSGKVRHLSIKELWVQEALRKNEFSLRVVDTLLNWADVVTKSLEKDRLDSLMLQVTLGRGEGERRQWRLRQYLSCLLRLPTRTTRRVEETTDVVGPGAVGCGDPRSVLRGIEDAGGPRSATSGAHGRGQPRPVLWYKLAVIDCDTVLTSACWGARKLTDWNRLWRRAEQLVLKG